MGRKDKIKIPKDQMIKCNAIIHGASASAAGIGAGLAQLPLADSALITPIQVAMIIALGKVFDQEISKAAATAILGGASAALAGRGLSQLLVGWIPFVGNAINTATAAGVTEAVGWIAVDNFSKDAYKSIISENPLSEEEKKEASQEAERNKKEKLEQREELIARAQVFLSGSKNRKTDKAEYEQLLNDFDKFLIDILPEDPIYDMYNMLSDLK